MGGVNRFFCNASKEKSESNFKLNRCDPSKNGCVSFTFLHFLDFPVKIK